MHTPSHFNRPRLPVCIFVLGLLVLVAGPGVLRAQQKNADHYGLVFLKDGFVLQGKINREGTTTEVDDASGTPFFIPKGFFQVDTGPTRIVFSPQQVRHVTKMDMPLDDRIDNFYTPVLGPAPAIADIMDVGPFNQKLERDIKFRITQGKEYITTQKIGAVSPFYVRLDSTKNWAWASAYFTREFNPQDIEGLLSNHPSFVERPGMLPAERATRRFRYADFFIRAGWYDSAEPMLDSILKEIPAEKERVVERQTAIAKLRARDNLEAIKRLHAAGQHTEVQKRLAKFTEKDAPEDVLASYREIKAEYAGVKERADQVKAYLDDLTKKIEKIEPKFAEAAKAILDDLTPETLPRLETFLSQAKQAERQLKAKKKPDLAPTELMSLAVTGWLLGNGAAEATPGVALQLWRTRQMLIDYLRDDSGVNGGRERKKMLAAYLSERNDSTALDDIMRMIPTLPPVEPETKITDDTVEVKVKNGPLYQMKLPPEYRHGRSYPVLIVLHKAGEKLGAAIDKWAEAAADNGYILVAPEWEGKAAGYTYGDQNEHEILLATLRDVRRHYQIDSDRVFLFGQGEGAKMAHDVALSHPDMFAGVSTMGGDFEYYPKGYWRNGQYLPFYVITGTQMSKTTEEHVKDMFTNWTGRNYPMLWVDYKGRGADWFGAEVPNIFDWMRNKRRALPIHQLGTDGLGGPFGDEYYTVRPGDNHFYWLSAEPKDIDSRCLIPSYRQFGKVNAARMTAKIDATKNEIRLATNGMKQVTIWLGRNAKGENMIDWDKDLTVFANLSAPLKKKAADLKPSAEVLLEDLYNRGDRQQLFMQKVIVPLR
jgi:dienelactone hydrolase